jgi:hypothetical protein
VKFSAGNCDQPETADQPPPRTALPARLRPPLRPRPWPDGRPASHARVIPDRLTVAFTLRAWRSCRVGNHLCNRSSDPGALNAALVPEFQFLGSGSGREAQGLDRTQKPAAISSSVKLGSKRAPPRHRVRRSVAHTGWRSPMTFCLKGRRLPPASGRISNQEGLVSGCAGTFATNGGPRAKPRSAPDQKRRPRPDCASTTFRCTAKPKWAILAPATVVMIRG